MIRFFRNIRYDLLNESKVGKYFKYAIGEVILVVVGILIALQINNWNEQRKINIQVEELFIKTYEELEYNLISVNKLMAYYRPKDSIFYRIRRDSIKVSESTLFSRCIDCILQNYKPISISTDAAENLFSYNSRVSIKQKELITALDEFYKIYKRDLDEIDKELKDIVLDHNNFIRDTKPWYNAFNNPKFPKFEKEVLTYYLEDPIYENWVAQYEQAAGGHRKTAINFKSEGLAIYNNLSEYFELIKDTALVPDLNKNKQYLGIYMRRGNQLKISFREDGYYYSWSIDIVPQERRIFFDSDSTAYFDRGFMEFKDDTLKLTGGSKNMLDFIKN